MASMKYKDPTTGKWVKVGLGSVEKISADKVPVSTNTSNPLGLPSGASVDAALQKLTVLKAPAYTYGTEEITEGSASPYEEGHVHFVYEP